MNIETLKMLKETQQDIYKDFQVLMLFHTNKMEGSTFTQLELTTLISEGIVTGQHEIDDVMQTKNSIELFDYVIDTLNEPLTQFDIRTMNQILMKETSHAKRGFAGQYKLFPNKISGSNTKLAEPHEVENRLEALLSTYKARKMNLIDIATFHLEFETIHPFSDGNGRIGRMIIMKQCLENGVTIPLITDENARLYKMTLDESRKVGIQPLVFELEKAQELFKTSSVNEFINKIEIYHPLRKQNEMKM